MSTLPLKLTVTPLLILAASLAIRRWGEIVGGWFVGLPLTSAPVCFFLALDQGVGFAAAACLGSLAGAASEAAFGLAYSLAARRRGWPPALGVASLAFAAGGFVFTEAAVSLRVAVPMAVAALAAALSLMPRLGAALATLPRAPVWEIPARMVVATGLVLGLTALAPYVGPRLSGLLATYPVFAAVLAAFSHRGRGAAAAVQVLRGLLIGLFAFTGFFAVLAVTIVPLGLAPSFALATLLALAIQGGSLALMRRR
ncbi:MAG TPA: hypothetical protein VG308_00605 [Stellaceae bacterium]|nr:hypothetical protein [Stellaceae bacterium]